MIDGIIFYKIQKTKIRTKPKKEIKNEYLP